MTIHHQKLYERWRLVKRFAKHHIITLGSDQIYFTRRQ